MRKRKHGNSPWCESGGAPEPTASAWRNQPNGDSDLDRRPANSTFF